MVSLQQIGLQRNYKNKTKQNSESIKKKRMKQTQCQECNNCCRSEPTSDQELSQSGCQTCYFRPQCLMMTDVKRIYTCLKQGRELLINLQAAKT